MGVVDNQLNWRKVYPDTGVDVSGWSLAKRMALPDWCFGNREAIGCEVNCVNADQDYWAISEIVLPDPVCFWSLGFWFRQPAFARIRFRFGLRATIPTSVAEMNGATEILPYIGAITTGPNYLRIGSFDTFVTDLVLRKGMATGGLKLVMEVQSTSVNTRADLFVVYSELPTEIPAFSNPNIP